MIKWENIGLGPRLGFQELRVKIVSQTAAHTLGEEATENKIVAGKCPPKGSGTSKAVRLERTWR